MAPFKGLRNFFTGIGRVHSVKERNQRPRGGGALIGSEAGADLTSEKHNTKWIVNCAVLSVTLFLIFLWVNQGK